jgi:hypothetical protein
MVLSGHSTKNARPQVINLQLAREWLVILIYRPYYRPVVGISHTKRTDGADTTSTIAVGVSQMVQNPADAHCSVVTDLQCV